MEIEIEEKKSSPFDGLKHIEHWRIVTLGLILYDILAMAASYFSGLWLRFDCEFSAIPDYYMRAYIRFIPIYIGISLLVFWRLRLYRSIWRFASYSELLRTGLASS